MATVKRPSPTKSHATPGKARAGAGGAHKSLSQRLKKAGLLSGKRAPSGGKAGLKLGKMLLKNLGLRGFGGGKGPLEQQLTKSVAAFQQANGLPATGELDAATVALLEKAGAFDEGATALAKKFETPETFDFGRQTGAQTALPAGASLRGSDLSAPGKNAQEQLGALLGKPADDAPPPQDKAQSTSQQAAQTPVRGLASQSTLTHAHARTDGQFAKSPTGKGVQDGEPDATQGRGKKGKGHGQGEGGDEDASPKEADKKLAPQADVDAPFGRKKGETGNAPSGDEDEDKKHGRAAIDDPSAEDAQGYWKAPDISIQVEQALSSIQHQPHGERFSIDVRFYKSGVYGAGQKPPELLHLQVVAATADDPVWQRARNKLNALLQARKCAPISRKDLDTALSRARLDRFSRTAD